MTERALFLDRDGVMCHMVEYPNGFDSAQSVRDVKLIEGIDSVIQAARNRNWKVIEISNQPGVAKGKQTQELSDAIEQEVHTLLGKIGVKVDDVYICNHHPQGVVPGLTKECDCRKPKPGLLIKAAKEHSINLASSTFYGDKASDVQAALAAGCKSMILLHDEDSPEKVEGAKSAPADSKVKNHEEACAIISRL